MSDTTKAHTKQRAEQFADMDSPLPHPTAVSDDVIAFLLSDRGDTYLRQASAKLCKSHGGDPDHPSVLWTGHGPVDQWEAALRTQIRLEQSSRNANPPFPFKWSADGFVGPDDCLVGAATPMWLWQRDYLHDMHGSVVERLERRLDDCWTRRHLLPLSEFPDDELELLVDSAAENLLNVVAVLVGVRDGITEPDWSITIGDRSATVDPTVVYFYRRAVATQISVEQLRRSGVVDVTWTGAGGWLSPDTPFNASDPDGGTMWATAVTPARLADWSGIIDFDIDKRGAEVLLAEPRPVLSSTLGLLTRYRYSPAWIAAYQAVGWHPHDPDHDSDDHTLLHTLFAHYYAEQDDPDFGTWHLYDCIALDTPPLPPSATTGEWLATELTSPDYQPDDTSSDIELLAAIVAARAGLCQFVSAETVHGDHSDTMVRWVYDQKDSGRRWTNGVFARCWVELHARGASVSAPDDRWPGPDDPIPNPDEIAALVGVPAADTWVNLGYRLRSKVGTTEWDPTDMFA